MKVFLTGGSGFIGSRLAKSLLEAGYTVVALVETMSCKSAKALAQMGAECIEGDIRNTDSLKRVMLGIDLVVHCAAWYELGIDSSVKQRMYEINVVGTKNILNLAHESKVKRTIYVSSAIIYGETGDFQRDESFVRNKPFRSYYEETKYEAHQIAQEFQSKGMPLIITCPNAVVGENDHSPYGYMLRMYIHRLLPLIPGDPKVIFSMVYVDDFVEGLMLAISKGQPGHTYIFSGEPTSFNDLVSIWGCHLNRKEPLIVNLAIPTIVVNLLEKMQRKLGLPSFISKESIEANQSRDFSNAKAKRELGWNPMSAHVLWEKIICEELALAEKRIGRSPVSLLKPL